MLKNDFVIKPLPAKKYTSCNSLKQGYIAKHICCVDTFSFGSKTKQKVKRTNLSVNSEVNPKDDLISFYLNKSKDNKGRTLNNILSLNFEQLEQSHDYIQWLFPLKTKSLANSQAPILSTRDIERFNKDNTLQTNMKKSFDKMLQFYGFDLTYVDDVPKIIKAGNHKDCFKNWLTLENHNFKRITRILTSLNLLGLEEHSKSFFKALQELYPEYSHIIGSKTFMYWMSVNK